MTTVPDRTIYAESALEAARVRALLNSHEDPRWHAGSAEPWIANLLGALVRALDPTTVIEVGGFEGYTSRKLAKALAWLPHDTKLTVCEIDERRTIGIREVLDHLDTPSVKREVVCADSHAWLPALPNRSVDFVWLDGNHEKLHVAEELRLLWPKMSDTGIIALHDVYGVCDLQEVVRKFHGLALDLPRLGPAGGIGLIQPGRVSV